MEKTGGLLQHSENGSPLRKSRTRFQRVASGWKPKLLRFMTLTTPLSIAMLAGTIDFHEFQTNRRPLGKAFLGRENTSAHASRIPISASAQTMDGSPISSSGKRGRACFSRPRSITISAEVSRINHMDSREAGRPRSRVRDLSSTAAPWAHTSRKFGTAKPGKSGLSRSALKVSNGLMALDRNHETCTHGYVQTGIPAIR